jgi:hypothetical protein
MQDVARSSHAGYLVYLPSNRAYNSGIQPTAFGRGSEDVRRVEGDDVTFETIRGEADQGTIVVVRAFVHSWRRPSWVALSGVGHMFADGLIVERNGFVADAPGRTHVGLPVRLTPHWSGRNSRTAAHCERWADGQSRSAK